MSLSTLLAVCSGVAVVVYGISCLTSTSMQVEFTRFGFERFRVLTGVLEVLGEWACSGACSGRRH